MSKYIIIDMFDTPWVVTDENGDVLYFESKEVAEAYGTEELHSHVVVELPD